MSNTLPDHELLTDAGLGELLRVSGRHDPADGPQARLPEGPVRRKMPALEGN